MNDKFYFVLPENSSLRIPTREEAIAKAQRMANSLDVRMIVFQAVEMVDAHGAKKAVEEEVVS